MKKIINGKTYNTDTAKMLFEESIYCNGNYCGSDDLYVTKSGVFFAHETSNGQNLYRRSGIYLIGDKESAMTWLNGREINDEEYKRLNEHGLIVEA